MSASRRRRTAAGCSAATTRSTARSIAPAASAELGIGKVYRSLDTNELTKFLETNALFHAQYQKFGRVKFEKTSGGAKMIYTAYPCYSPMYCASAFGYFLESILRHGGSEPKVMEPRCQCRGDASCTFEMVWR